MRSARSQFKANLDLGFDIAAVRKVSYKDTNASYFSCYAHE